MKTIFLTGATGFVGTEILKELLKNGYHVKVLVRDKRRLKVENPNIEVMIGDILDFKAVSEGVRGCDAVINLVGIIREYPKKEVTFNNMHVVATKNLVDAAKKHGVKRFVHMSANGTRKDAVTLYHRTKYMAEEYIIDNKLDYTILRPSLIYGKNDSFINMLNDMMKRLPVFAYFGDGSYPLQPVSVEEVAEIFVRCLEVDATINQIYSVCGKDLFTYRELLNIIMEITGRKRLLVPVPEVFVEIGIALFGKFSWFPITKDQFLMLKEGNTCNDKKIFEITGVKMRDFKQTLAGYLR